MSFTAKALEGGVPLEWFETLHEALNEDALQHGVMLHAAPPAPNEQQQQQQAGNGDVLQQQVGRGGQGQPVVPASPAVECLKRLALVNPGAHANAWQKLQTFATELPEDLTQTERSEVLETEALSLLLAEVSAPASGMLLRSGTADGHAGAHGAHSLPHSGNHLPGAQPPQFAPVALPNKAPKLRAAVADRLNAGRTGNEQKLLTAVLSEGVVKYKVEPDSTESLKEIDAADLLMAAKRLNPYYASRGQGQQFEQHILKNFELQKIYAADLVFKWEYAVRQRFEEDPTTSLSDPHFELMHQHLMAPSLLRSAAQTSQQAQQRGGGSKGQGGEHAGADGRPTRAPRPPAPPGPPQNRKKESCIWFLEGKCEPRGGGACTRLHLCPQCGKVSPGAKGCPCGHTAPRPPGPPSKKRDYDQMNQQGRGGGGGFGRNNNR